MEREARYVVLKIKDLDKSLTALEIRILTDICAKVAESRAAAGKTPLRCVVVESDWPEYEPTWKLIERRVDAKPAQGKCDECGGGGVVYECDGFTTYPKPCPKCKPAGGAR